MKQKIGMLIEKNTLRLAKRKAAEDGRPPNDLIQDALEQYLRKISATPRERQIAFHLFCEQPMKIPQEQLRYVLNENMWNG